MKVLLNVSMLVCMQIILSVGTEVSSLINSPVERVPVNVAISTLEEVVKETNLVRDFCHKHFSQELVNCLSPDHPTSKFRASNCADIFNAGNTSSGIYSIFLIPDVLLETKVYCDMETAGGGWTVFQRRGEFSSTHPPINFTRSWKEYVGGFGNLSEEFWLGNENIHRLSTQGEVTLRIEMMDYDGNFRFANYGEFKIGDEKEDYKLKIEGYNGNAGDSLKYHNRMKFSVDSYCAKKFKSGWWFRGCHHSNLNGERFKGHEIRGTGIVWFDWKGPEYSLKWTEMKLRPKDVIPMKKK